MKAPSNLLKTINIIINFFWGVLIFFTVLFIPVTYFFPLPIEVNFKLRDIGKIIDSNNEAYQIEITDAKGLIGFTNDDFTSGLPEILTFWGIVLVSLFIFYQFKKVTNSVTRNSTFELSNFKRIRWMGIAFFAFIIIDTIHFFMVNNYYAELIKFNAIAIDTSYNLFHNFNLYDFFCGIGLIGLSEVFKEGFSLKQETELTI